MKCCICGKPITKRTFITASGEAHSYYEANNPYPINKDEDAVCCNECNARYVIPARLREHEKAKA